MSFMSLFDEVSPAQLLLKYKAKNDSATKYSEASANKRVSKEYAHFQREHGILLDKHVLQLADTFHLKYA